VQCVVVVPPHTRTAQVNGKVELYCSFGVMGGFMQPQVRLLALQRFLTVTVH
jgi:hypothetical protein